MLFVPLVQETAMSMISTHEPIDREDLEASVHRSRCRIRSRSRGWGRRKLLVEGHRCRIFKT